MQRITYSKHLSNKVCYVQYYVMCYVRGVLVIV